MAQVGISVGGATAFLPGAYVQTFVTPVVPTGTGNTGPLVFLAAGYGGVPFVPTNFTSANDLTAAMRGAPSVDFIPFMFNPSSEVNGASVVTYINIAPNTQSSATIVSSGGTNVINMTSADYGTPSNSVQYSIGAGSTAGVAMTLHDGFSGLSFTGDNLGVPFQLAYTGASSGVTYTVSSTITGKATGFTITSPVMGESVQLDLTSPTYATVSQLVQELNGTGFYTCLVIGDGTMPTADLDVVSNISLPVPVASVDQYINVTATLGAVVWFINHHASTIATGAIVNSIISAPSLVPALVSNQFFSGATNQVPSLANYASGFNVALNVPAWAVIADSNTSGVRALGAQHVATASATTSRQWRRFVTGSAAGEAFSTAITNSLETNQLNVTYCWPGITQTSTVTGLNTVYDGNHVAAAVAGMFCGNPAATPVTNKTLLGTGVEQITQPANYQSLQNGGVLVLNLDPNTRVPTLLADVDTWQNDPNPANVYNQQVSCRYALSYYLVRQLQPYVGNISSNFSIQVARNAAVNILNQLIYNGQNAIGILNSWDPSTLVLTYDGATQSLTISVAVVFVGQNLFVVVNVTVNPLNIVISSTGTITNG